MAKKLGKYKVLEEVGRGGMAVVYKAHQESLDRIVAIKELDLSRTSSDVRAKDRFILEARSVASLDHPSIVTVHDFWERSNKAYIAMEFVDGLEVKELLERSGPVPPLAAAFITLQIARALAFTHERGIVHRDIKPGNIMLSNRGQVKLADFGIALVSGTADLTTTGQVIGTPAYMSPEQIRGEEMGPASDIFSLGSVLYEMITGVKPFSGPSDAAVIHAIIHKRPISPRRLQKAVPRRLTSIIRKCLKKKAGRRYATMSDLVSALEKSLRGRESQGEQLVAQLVTRSSESAAQDATIPLTDQQPEADGQKRWTTLGAVAAAVVAVVVLLWAGDTNKPDNKPAPAASVTVPVTVHAYPWAEVKLDGMSLGFTPMARPVSVPPGEHTLELVNPYLGSRKVELSLSEGDSPFITVDLLEGK
jgi:serine/threonine-protein kinase